MAWQRRTRALKKGNGRVPFLALILIAMIGYLGMAYYRADARLAELQARTVAAKERLRAAQEENRLLNEKIERLNTDMYIEKVAREHLGLTKPGEIPYLMGRPSEDEPEPDKTR